MIAIRSVSTLTIFCLLASCASRPGPPERRIEALVDELVVSAMEEQRIPGAAFVLVRDGRVAMIRGYGLANRERRIPVDAERTIFRVGSVSKVLTALALTQLVDRGRVSFEDAVAPLVDESIRVDAFEEPVRVRHLLAHTGGFDQIGRNRQVDDIRLRPSLAEFLRNELVPIRPPGVVGVYDTYGITLAGHLIEVLGGQNYSAFMRENVFRPLGMNDTFVEVPEAFRERLARGYGIDDGMLVSQNYELYVTLPASSIDATVADMGRLLLALLGDGSTEAGRVLSAQTTRRIQREPQKAYAAGLRGFSYGFWEDQHRGSRILYHGGIMKGYSSELVLIPDEAIGWFVAYTRDPETGPPAQLREQLRSVLVEALLPDSEAPPAESIALDTTRFAGAYGSTIGCYTCAPGEGWGINFFRVRAPEPGVIESSRRWRAVAPLQFESEEGSRLAFLADDQGFVRYLVTGPESYARLDRNLLDEVLGTGWEERPATWLEAVVHLANEDWARSLEVHAELAERMPENGRVHYYAALSALHEGDAERARHFFERALELGQWRGWSLYYIASTHAAEGNASSAFETLELALERGFGDSRLLETESWWNGLRGHSSYSEILERLRGPR